MKKNKLMALILSGLMTASALPTGAYAASVGSSTKAGTYTGVATGFKGDVTVTLTVADVDGEMKITDIAADGPEETPKYWESAITVLDKIKESNGTDGVDTVSGATRSSSAIIEATDKALAKALSGFSGGTGTVSDPYIISSAAGLEHLRAEVEGGNTFEGKYIAIDSDITLSGEWTPIGVSRALPFSGVIDGRGHTIDGMTITKPVDGGSTMSAAGFIGFGGNGVSVKNLSLTNVSINVNNVEKIIYAGGLIGFMNNDTSGNTQSFIDSCSVEGSITVTTADKVASVGGLVGMSCQRAAVTNNGVDVDVTVNSGSGRATIGGFIGWVSIQLLSINNYSLGDVNVTSTNATYGNVGGMFGQVNGIIYNCFTAGNVTFDHICDSPKSAGALAGDLAAATYMDSCYYVNGDKAFTGSGSYNSETVLQKELSEIAVLLHDNLSPAAIEAVTARVKTANVTNCSDLGAMMARMPGELQDWELVDGVPALTGTPWSSGEVDDSIFESGDGSAEAPYVIKTPKQLSDFAHSINDKIDYTGMYVILDGDIDMSESEWYPIGGSDYAFNGSFSGKGNSVTGLHIGTEDEPKTLAEDEPFVGFFGVLGSKAVVSDLSVDVNFHTEYSVSTYLGGIAGYIHGSGVSGDYTGAIIDNCTTSGVISHKAVAGNQFVGGIVGMQYKGAIINSSASVALSGIVEGGDLAEVGGLVGINNRGLVANCRSNGSVYASGNRDNGNEGMAVASDLVACNAGMLVNCLASGDITTREYSTYAGMASGWVTGIGKTYLCWYDLNSTMYIGEKDVKQYVDPVEPIGTKVASGVNDEGDAYTGGLVDRMTGFNAENDAVAGALNANFDKFPADITIWGVGTNALREWTFNGENVVLGDSNASITYEQPACETVEKPELRMNDGVWYGRSGKTVLKVTAADNEVIDIEVISGETSGSDYDAALEKAAQKAVYGDFSHYFAADTTKFGGGRGTVNSPYLIENEEQLRYLAYSINADTDWKGVYFRQTADITLEDGDWLPIGWALNAEVNGAKTLVAAYPFRGNYDGGNFTITGLTIGAENAPADMMTAGFFGLTSGELTSNDKPTGKEQTVTLRNIHLKDLYINVETRYETYIGGLVGNAQYGIYVDSCSIEGEITSVTSESFSRAGGLAGSILRGAVTNSCADVDITGITGTNHVYAGGFYGMDNRVTTFNCYALGNVTGNSDNNNKVHLGGFVGQAGGIHYNCYTYGDVVSLKTTTDVGAINGRSGGIAADLNCYYNSESLVKQGNTIVSPVAAVGVNANDKALIENVVGKTAAELTSEEFAALLNANIRADAMSDAMKVLDDFLVTSDGRGYTQQNYYTGNELSAWELRDSTVTFGEVEKAYPMEIELDGSFKTVYKVGDDLDVSGMTIVVSLAGGASYEIDVTEDMITGFDSSEPGIIRLTITYKGFTANCVITVEEDEEPEEPDEPTIIIPIEQIYRVRISQTEGGKVESDKTRSFAGRVFTLTVTPDEGYELVMLTVIDSGGNEIVGKDGSYIMPKSDVMVAAVFAKTETEPEPEPEIPFPFGDVNKSDWFYDDVKFVFENKLMNGVTADTFEPGLTTTRGMIVTVLYRLAGEPEVTGKADFDDIASGSYYEKAVIWASENGIVNGYGDGKFGPNDEVTREQLAAILCRYAKLMGIDTTESADLSAFKDADKVSSWSVEALGWANANKLINGIGGGLLDPAGKATRAQVAAILHRFVENIG